MEAIHQAEISTLETAQRASQELATVVQATLESSLHIARFSHAEAAEPPQRRISLGDASALADRSLKKRPPLQEPLRLNFWRIFRRPSREKKEKKRNSSVWNGASGMDLSPALVLDPIEEIYGELLPTPGLQGLLKAAQRQKQSHVLLSVVWLYRASLPHC